MQLKDFQFELPERLIATNPLAVRDQARLLEVNNHHINDCIITDLASLLHKGDVLVLNNSKVIPAKLKGYRETTIISFNLNRQISSNSWQVLVRPAKKIKEGDIINITEGFFAKVKHKTKTDIIFEFNLSNNEFYTKLAQVGSIPLPPYMKREANNEDIIRYQTIYAKYDGSVAAPTAGLHFTPTLLNKLKEKGVIVEFITLHVGAGTFLPVKTEDITQHKIHTEWCSLSKETAEAINLAKQENRRVIAVGTTVCRLLEYVATNFNQVKAYQGDTNIFIFPGYKFKVVDNLLTNFHLPCSTLVMLVCAFAGYDNIMNSYNHAIKNNYRFYSYGDATFLHKHK